MSNFRPSFLYRVLHLKVVKNKANSIGKARMRLVPIWSQKREILELQPFFFKTELPASVECRSSFFKAVILLMYATALFLRDFN